MKNPLQVSQWRFSSVILVLWIIFSVVYVANGVKANIISRVYTSGQQNGATNAVVQAMSLAQKCQPVVLTAGEASVTLVNPACPEGGAPAAAAEGDAMMEGDQ